MGVVTLVAAAAAFVAKVGVGMAAMTWGLAAIPASVACLLVAAMPGLRGRIRPMPAFLGALAVSSLAGWLVIVAYSLDVSEISHRPPNKLDPPAPAAAALYQSATAAGAVIGLLLVGLASWLCTRRLTDRIHGS